MAFASGGQRINGDFVRGERLCLLRQDRPLPAFDLMDLTSGKRATILHAEHLPLYLAQFSPDGRWIVFLAHFGPGHSAIYAARAKTLFGLVRPGIFPA